MKNVSIYKIAKEAGVSASTVSRVINNYPNIKTETRDKIIKLIDKMNYTPNLSARYLVSSRKEKEEHKGRMSVIVPESHILDNDPDTGPILSGIIYKASELGIELFTDTIKENHNNFMDLPTTISNGQVDGVIVLGELNKDLIDQMLNMNIPMVFIGHGYYFFDFKKEVDMILGDNIHGAYNAVKHLIDNGHKRICVLKPPETGLDDFSYSMHERLEGYKLALKNYEIKYDEELIKICTGYEDSQAAMKELLKLENPPTAVFSLGDSVALGAKIATAQSGKKIPDDISIITFDLFSVLELNITSMDINRKDVGGSAVTRLQEKIQNKNSPPVQIVVGARLTDRGSVRHI